MSANTANIEGLFGSTGTGKSAGHKALLKKRPPKRSIIWDPQDEYGEFGQVFSSRVALIDHISKRATFAAVFRPGDKLSEYPAAFDWLCRVVWAVGKLTFTVEELADVTKANHAPDAWSAITRKGRHKGLSVVAMSQRPALVDKTFFGNCTLIRCHRLTDQGDVDVMARLFGPYVMGPERKGTASLYSWQDDIRSLPDLHYVERQARPLEIRRGVVKLPRQSP